jgi:uncharacterized protein YndB with AHSA1/START domain
METSEREIVLKRVFNAPRELVFEAYSSVEHLSRWFGPDGYSTTTYSMDFRVGGSWKYMMHGPDGTDWRNLITYTEIDPPSRLSFDHGDFERVHFQVTLTFEDQDGKTSLTQHMLFPNQEARDHVIGFGAVELGNQTLARLAAHLEALR